MLTHGNRLQFSGDYFVGSFRCRTRRHVSRLERAPTKSFDWRDGVLQPDADCIYLAIRNFCALGTSAILDQGQKS